MEKNVIVCGIGWQSLYNPIIQMIFDYDDAQKQSVDKIGIKRIETDDGKLSIVLENRQNANAQIIEAINKACHKSLRVCELCGETNNIGTTMNNDYITCCHKCWESKILSKNSASIWKDYTTNKIYRKKI